jgi:hypothetical protein
MRSCIGCIFILFQLLFVFSGCKTDEKSIIEYYELVDSNSDIIDLFLSELSYKKIIFIGENHMWTNEEEFLANNLQNFY